MKDYHRFLNIPDYLPNIDVSKYKTKGMGWLQFHKQLQFEDLGNDKKYYGFKHKAKSLVKNFETVDTSSPSFLKIIRSIGGKYEIKKK